MIKPLSSKKTVGPTRSNCVGPLEYAGIQYGPNQGLPPMKSLVQINRANRPGETPKVKVEGLAVNPYDPRRLVNCPPGALTPPWQPY